MCTGIHRLLSVALLSTFILSDYPPVFLSCARMTALVLVNIAICECDEREVSDRGPDHECERRWRPGPRLVSLRLASLGQLYSRFLPAEKVAAHKKDCSSPIVGAIVNKIARGAPGRKCRKSWEKRCRPESP